MTSETMTVAKLVLRYLGGCPHGLLTTKISSVTWPLSHLRKTLCTALDDQDHIEEELEALKEVHTNTGPVAVNAKGNVAVILQSKANISTFLRQM
jgi:hypothetical protein